VLKSALGEKVMTILKTTLDDLEVGLALCTIVAKRYIVEG